MRQFQRLSFSSYNLWISHNWAGAQPWMAQGGHRPTTWQPGPPTGEPGPGKQNHFPPPQNGIITDKNTPQFHQLSRWLVSDDPAGEEARCGGPGLAQLHVVCGCEAS
jgi:hypothetical protein